MQGTPMDLWSVFCSLSMSFFRGRLTSQPYCALASGPASAARLFLGFASGSSAVRASCCSAPVTRATSFLLCFQLQPPAASCRGSPACPAPAPPGCHAWRKPAGPPGSCVPRPACACSPPCPAPQTTRSRRDQPGEAAPGPGPRPVVDEQRGAYLSFLLRHLRQGPGEHGRDGERRPGVTLRQRCSDALDLRVRDAGQLQEPALVLPL